MKNLIIILLTLIFGVAILSSCSDSNRSKSSIKKAVAGRHVRAKIGRETVLVYLYPVQAKLIRKGDTIRVSTGTALTVMNPEGNRFAVVTE